MEKTNELNKFLSYMHMGNTIYRIYLEHAKKLENEKLIHLIIEIQEIFNLQFNNQFAPTIFFS